MLQMLPLFFPPSIHVVVSSNKLYVSVGLFIVDVVHFETVRFFCFMLVTKNRYQAAERQAAPGG